MKAVAGIGLRAPHLGEIDRGRPATGFLEIHAENYLTPSPALAIVERLRADYRFSVHAVGLSLGAVDGLDEAHLARVAALVKRLEPDFVSDHLSWCTFGGRYFNDLLPLPCTEEALEVVARNLCRLQEALGRQVSVENPSCYLDVAHSTMSEPAFLGELVRRTGCGLLLDANNIHVTAHNLGLDPHAWLDGLPAAAITEYHIAGHAVNEADGATILIDDHGSKVDDTVWALYAECLARFGARPTVVEWDSDIPALPVLLGEAVHAAGLLGREVRMTLALREWQATVAAQLVAGGGEARLAIHRHHIASSLAEALGTTFSTVRALVGEDFFRQVAQAFVARELPTQPVLAEYGAGFADFIAAHPSAQDLPYLADVARLDWALNVAFHSPRGPRLTTADLSAVPPERLAASGFGLAPGTVLVRSAYPLDLIWAASQPGASEDTVKFHGGTARLLVLRRADDSAFVMLDEGEAAFVTALAAGQTAGEAAGAAFAVEPAFDLTASFARLLACEVFAALQH